MDIVDGLIHQIRALGPQLKAARKGKQNCNIVVGFHEDGNLRKPKVTTEGLPPQPAVAYYDIINVLGDVVRQVSSLGVDAVVLAPDQRLIPHVDETAPATDTST